MSVSLSSSTVTCLNVTHEYGKLECMNVFNQSDLNPTAIQSNDTNQSVDSVIAIGLYRITIVVLLQ